MQNHYPHQAPQNHLDDGNYEIPPLYNPNAAALWSILFIPFGAWIHAKNWEAVGEDELAKQNHWCIIMMLVFVFGTYFVEMTTGIKIPSSIALGLLFGWYFWLGKKQIALFKEELGTDYEKKSLVMPVLVGVFGGMSAVVVGLFVMYTLLSMFGLLHPTMQ